jgi:predicted NAD/FAD-binding protein
MCLYKTHSHVLRMGSVTNNSRGFGLDTGFIPYGDYNYTKVTIMVNTLALVVS